MSWAALEYIRRMIHAPSGERLTSSEKLLALMLAYHHSEEVGEAWPSVRLLAQESVMSEQTVKRTRQRLVRKGLIEVRQLVKDNGSFSSSRYTFPHLNTDHGDTRTKSTHPLVQNGDDTRTESTPPPYNPTPRKKLKEETKERMKEENDTLLSFYDGWYEKTGHYHADDPRRTQRTA